MEAKELSEILSDMRGEVIDDLVEEFIPPKTYADQWNGEGLYAAAIERLGVDVPVIDWIAEEGVDDETIAERLDEATAQMMAQKTEAFGADTMRQIEKQILLQTIDGKWREHLLTLEHLRSVVGFRGYAQRDPLNEYKTESFQLFERMLDSLRTDVTQKLAQIRPLNEEEQRQMMEQYAAQQAAMAAPAEPKPSVVGAANPPIEGFVETDPTTWGNPARNDACPCGSGNKFKHCHGRFA